ncbi:histidine kinase [Akkermansiaceae bacterium]|nr:histidine kinase [Akkermansiaceae bacterium]
MKLPTLLILLFATHFLGAEETANTVRVELNASAEDPASPTFDIHPANKRVRYRLKGLNTKWTEKADEMNLVVRFLTTNGDHLKRLAYGVSGQSPGWNGDPESSALIYRENTVAIPPETTEIQFLITSSGSPQSLGIYFVKDLKVTQRKGEEKDTLMIKGMSPKWKRALWNQSGTHPSMALKGADFPRSLYVRDTDLSAHADWGSDPLSVDGDTLTISWQEAYSIGAGKHRAVEYERLPPGKYVFEVEELGINGLPNGLSHKIEIKVPSPLLQTLWFWLLGLLVLALIAYLFFRSLVKRRVRRAVRHARLIEDERLRIAMDLHDDIGTRLSQISLAGSHAEMKSSDSESKKSFRQITKLTGDLAASLSETVWMLSPKNNDLESLIGFLSRIASELCRAGEFRCRIDADPIDEEIKISQEFRHHFVLSVKEALNNALKHSGGSEISLAIRLNEGVLTVTVSDNGDGFDCTKISSGNGLKSLKKRMADLNGSLTLKRPASSGTTILMKAPLKQSEY